MRSGETGQRTPTIIYRSVAWGGKKASAAEFDFSKKRQIKYRPYNAMQTLENMETDMTEISGWMGMGAGHSGTANTGWAISLWNQQDGLTLIGLQTVNLRLPLAEKLGIPVKGTVKFHSSRPPDWRRNAKWLHAPGHSGRSVRLCKLKI